MASSSRRASARRPEIHPCGAPAQVAAQCIVGQPTHPAYYQRDLRQEVQRLQGQIRPSALAAPNSWRASPARSSRPRSGGHADRLAHEYSDDARDAAIHGAQSLRHWVRGVFLVTEVERGSATDGGDRITAINLTRRIKADDMPRQLISLSRHLARRRAAALDSEPACTASPSVVLRHFIGGPCLAVRPTGLALLREPTSPAVGEAVSTERIILGPAPGGAAAGGEPAAGSSRRRSQTTTRTRQRAVGQRRSLGGLRPARAEARRRGLTSALVRVVWGDARWGRAQLLGSSRAATGACARHRCTTSLLMRAGGANGRGSSRRERRRVRATARSDG